MRLRRSHVVTWLLACCCGLSSVAGVRAQPEDGRERIEVSAEESIEVRREGEAVRARGNVEVRHRESVFGADSVEIDRSRRTLRAEGAVRLRDPRYRLRASRLEVDLANETGTVLDGRFTTCLCEDGAAPWRIGAREFRLDEDGNAAMDDVTFYVYDVPVLYLPRATFPYATDRATGLLFPSLGWSDRAGLRYGQPFFWALDESNDLTLNLAVESRTRVGFTGQVRTVLNAGAAGRLDVSYFNERLRDDRAAEDTGIADPAIPVDRWSILLTHRHRAPWTTFSDVALYSDSFVTRELMEFSDLSAADKRLARTSRYSASRLGFYRHAAGMTLKGELDYVQDLVQPQPRALHRVPHVAFSGARRLGRSLDLGWDATLTRYVRQEWADGLRIDLRPELTWPVTVGRHFRLATSVALRETLYRLDSVGGRFDPTANDFTGKFARTSSRELVEIRSRLATSLSRTYQRKNGAWRRVRHVLEPAVEYLFIPATDQSDAPIWDSVDRIRRRNLVTLSLTNRFWGMRRPVAPPDPPSRGAPGRDGQAGSADDFARARVAASFDIDRTRGGEDGLSDLSVGVGVNPADNLDVAVSLGIDPGPWNLRQAALGFSLVDDAPPDTNVGDGDFRRPNGVSVSYRHVRANPLSPLARHANLLLLADCPGDPRCLQGEALDVVQADALFRVTDRLLLLYDGSYDAASGRLTRNQAGVKYLSRCKCWTLALSVDSRANPDRTLLAVKFKLLGLGS